MLADRIHTLAYVQKYITTKVESVCYGPDMFIMSADEAKRKALQPSLRINPDMREPRAPVTSIWQNRRKDAFAKDRKRLTEGLASIHPVPPMM